MTHEEKLEARMKKFASAIVVVALSAWGMAVAAEPAPKLKLEFKRAETKAAEGLTEAKVGDSDKTIYLHKEADLTNDDIASARVIEDENRPVVEIVFTKEGAKKAAKLSEEHQDKPVAIVVDGKVITAPIIRSKLSEKAQFTGKFTKAEAERIAKGIKPD